MWLKVLAWLLILGLIFFRVDLGVMPGTNVAIVPYLVAIVYLSTLVRYSDFVLLRLLRRLVRNWRWCHFHSIISTGLYCIYLIAGLII